MRKYWLCGIHKILSVYKVYTARVAAIAQNYTKMGGDRLPFSLQIVKLHYIIFFVN
ncbi:hypothetical protein LC609_21505 [Nostoc sp. XA013]|nr:hypothetical protein [Nostoc sp. XA013]